jgi:hypothetical protein
MLSKANLMIYQGDDYQAVVTVSDGVTPPGQILTGYTAQAQIRNGPADTNAAILVEIETAMASPDINLTIPHADTVTLTNGPYAWDLQLIAADGTINTILAGAVYVTLEVTR